MKNESRVSSQMNKMNIQEGDELYIKNNQKVTQLRNEATRTSNYSSQKPLSRQNIQDKNTDSMRTMEEQRNPVGSNNPIEWHTLNNLNIDSMDSLHKL